MVCVLYVLPSAEKVVGHVRVFIPPIVQHVYVLVSIAAATIKLPPHEAQALMCLREQLPLQVHRQGEGTFLMHKCSDTSDGCARVCHPDTCCGCT
jgi:hypothetical protein